MAYAPEVYREQQSLMRCGLHILNAIFQEQAFSVKELDAIGDELATGRSFFNPHRFPLGLGNYDVNILEVAFSRRGLRMDWHDPRDQVTAKQLQDSTLIGVVVNEMNSKFGGMFKSRHWYCLRKLKGSFYLIDSSKKQNDRMSYEETRWFLNEKKNSRVHIFNIREGDVEVEG
uniref:ubiquitinyl hydrolase 1 n=1 Tax=Rhodosorus marinus TaxID=101924 RepID=A0A7S0G7G2_9RHOD|mmetsp:Transcript_368/g.428  ORF Transcript_368/g.428 Transcript_368/m.428 type:complete len:173 (+) Transcript_368:185-703(+)